MSIAALGRHVVKDQRDAKPKEEGLGDGLIIDNRDAGG